MIKCISKADGIKTFRITEDNGIFVDIITFGARIAKLVVPDKDGNLVDIVAGFDNPVDFTGNNPYFNAIIGRVANRIGNSSFNIDTKTYTVSNNEGKNSLHGGISGFDQKLWSAIVIDEDSLMLNYTSQDGEEGYPGNLSVSVTYSLKDTSLIISYQATTDKTTPCSLTNHAYFNLNGDFESVLNHTVQINAYSISDIDDELIPTGKSYPIDNTPYDFNIPKKIGRDIKKDDKYLNLARGYDFNYILDNDATKPVASAIGDKTGIKLEVITDQPCLQFYTGNFLDGLQGKKTYGYQSAFCMEAQAYPNAVNYPNLPSVFLRPGFEYTAKCEYRFSVIK